MWQKFSTVFWFDFIWGRITSPYGKWWRQAFQWSVNATNLPSLTFSYVLNDSVFTIISPKKELELGASLLRVNYQVIYLKANVGPGKDTFVSSLNLSFTSAQREASWFSQWQVSLAHKRTGVRPTNSEAERLKI